MICEKCIYGSPTKITTIKLSQLSYEQLIGEEEIPENIRRRVFFCEIGPDYINELDECEDFTEAHI